MPRNNSRRGTALVLSALLCLAVVPFIGLAIDGGNSYMMRSIVSTAVDAAVLAGARSLNVGLDISSQASNATAVAQKVFDANLKDANWGSTNITRSVSIGQNSATHMRWVTVTGSADLPLTFLSLLNVKTAHISFTATAQRRDVNVVLVLDHSGSMLNAMGDMEKAATNFVNMFAAGRDNLGLVVFSGGTYVAYHPSVNFSTDSPSVTSMIGQLQSNNGATSTAQAVWKAYGELKTLNQPGALNVIVVFTDGLANTFAANFTPYITSASGCSDMTKQKVGVILADVTGQSVAGLSDPDAISLNDTPETRPAPNSDGCFWNTNIASTRWNIASALTGLPAFDSSGNSTNGTGTISAYLPVDLTQVNGANVTNAGLNAVDDAASRIRKDTTLNPIIYAIGLGGNPGMPPDGVLMARIANDPSSPSYNSSQAQGLYVFAPSTAQLHSAFIRIASEILRLAL